MDDSYEMRDLSAQSERQTEPDEAVEGKTNALTNWAWSSVCILLMLASVLTLSPRLLLFLSEVTSTDPRSTLTPLESFLAMNLGVSLAAVALIIIFNVPFSHPEDAEMLQRSAQPNAILVPLVLSMGLVAFLSYNTKGLGSLPTLVFLAYSVTSLWGLWIIVFGQPSSLSNKIGPDKHTSAFIFGNKAAASVKRKIWKQEQKRKF